MRYGLLGRTLKHSFSPQIHRLLFGYDYELFEREDVEAFLQERDFDGINVTIPYKETVMPYCAELSPRAKAIGSVNTILRRTDGTLYGENTDYFGFLYMIKKAGVAPRGKKAIVLGSGGASKTVSAVLENEGAGEVVIISRNGPNNYANLARHFDAQLIVNATPVGMYPSCGNAPIDLAGFSRCEAVLDVIYNPARTELLLCAEERGIPAVNGLSMLVAQAKAAGELFTNTVVPDAEIDNVTDRIERMTKNIVLIGMPGCGKSSVGKALSAQTGREFCDLDEKIALKAGMSIPEFFARYGEAEFRSLETATLEEESKQSGKIIAAGGGIVTVPENKRLLRRNSTCIWLKRPLAELPTDGRPVSIEKGVAQIYRERESLYADFAEKEYENCGIVETARQLEREL